MAVPRQPQVVQGLRHPKRLQRPDPRSLVPGAAPTQGPIVPCGHSIAPRKLASNHDFSKRLLVGCYDAGVPSSSGIIETIEKSTRSSRSH